MANIYAPGPDDASFPWRVAYVMREAHPRQQLIDDANARLIAAAPELLSVLKELIEGTDFSDAARERLALAGLAAIAKAEGSTVQA